VAADRNISWCLGDRTGDRNQFLPAVRDTFNQLVTQSGAAEFAVAIDVRGEVVATNTHDKSGHQLDEGTQAALRAYPWADAPWFQSALNSGEAYIDPSRFQLVPEELEILVEKRFHFGFAHRVIGTPYDWTEHLPVGVIVTLVPWTVVQEETSNYGVVKRREAGLGDLPSEDIYASTYAWVWADDARTILAHKDRGLYGKRVDEPPVSLPQMTAAALEKRWGMYPEYDFNGIHKLAAFRHGRSRDDDGFGWVIGVGVNTQDILGPIHAMTETIAKASAIVLLLAVVVTILVARRTTRPVQDLEAFTRRVASGDLDSRLEVRGHDELSDLARSFNRMTHHLKESRAQIVKAEKDAAWREMARQVAHEIKNPLTPIQLWASLLKRAHDEGSPEFPSILEKTIDVVQKQVRTMRDIAKDFYRFAGEHRDPSPVNVRDVLADVMELNSAWATEEGIELGGAPAGESNGSDLVVLADPDELRRALVNLISNAIEAMDGLEPPMGLSSHQIDAWATPEADGVRIVVRDTGKGISEDVESGLFEPYFTTRSSGTGLGLAIVRRIVEDRGGTVTLENRKDIRGAIAVIWLPLEGATVIS
ncbi:MAG: ATP-binding protein, partial [Planctomycetota bacterium]